MIQAAEAQRDNNENAMRQVQVQQKSSHARRNREKITNPARFLDFDDDSDRVTDDLIRVSLSRS
jgi:hypothetical protein